MFLASMPQVFLRTHWPIPKIGIHFPLTMSFSLTNKQDNPDVPRSLHIRFLLRHHNVMGCYPPSKHDPGMRLSLVMLTISGDRPQLIPGRNVNLLGHTNRTNT